MNSTAAVSRTQTDDSDVVYALRERIRALESALGTDWSPPLCLRLTATERTALGMLVKRPALCRHKTIAEVLYGNREDPPENEMELVRVFVCRIRSKLKRFDIEIRTQWGEGYFITPDNLDRLNALYAPGEVVP